MQRVVYILSLIFIYPVSILPFSVLYVVSDILYFLLYKVIGYRKKVVFTNLQNSFPQKSETEIKSIADKFYRHLGDVTVESIKSYTISPKEIAKRCPVINPEVFHNYYAQGRSAICITGHYGNWEWAALSSPFSTPANMMAIYQTLSNPYFDKFMRKNRSKFGLELIAADKVSRIMKTAMDTHAVTVFVGDQAPSNLKKSHWMHFLNQETPVNMAMEKFAQVTNAAVVFGAIRKKKRGFYEIELINVKENPAETAPGEITEKYMQMLENLINERPEYWLWSHRRWKHKRPQTQA